MFYAVKISDNSLAIITRLPDTIAGRFVVTLAGRNQFVDIGEYFVMPRNLFNSYSIRTSMCLLDFYSIQAIYKNQPQRIYQN